MAQMVPESLAGSAHATTGERRVFDLLRDCLVLYPDSIVWYEPRSARRLPDFLVWTPTWGLLVIEVKDWRYANIASANRNFWALRLADGSEKRRPNPLDQALRSLHAFKELLESSIPLRQETGPHAGSLRFPIAHCVIFTRISRSQASHQSGDLTRTLDMDRCLFRDDLPGEGADEQTRATFIGKLRHAFVHRFAFPQLSLAALETMRSLLFPEVRLPPARGPLGPLRTPEQHDVIHALDLTQERVAKQISSDHHVLKGVAGSGKSVVLACRAKFLQTQHPDWQILIVCFTRSLCLYLRQLVHVPGITAPEVIHFHGLVRQLSGAGIAPKKDEIDAAYEQRIGALLSSAIETGAIRNRYHAILIDEAQDLSSEWIRPLTKLLNPETNSLLLCLDPAQNIFGRRISYKSMGVNVVGAGHSSKLEKSYRNTAEILQLARIFSPASGESADTEDTGERTLFPLSTERHGNRPILITDMSQSEQIAFVLDEIDDLLDEHLCSLADIAVLYTERSWAKRFADAFTHRFSENRLFWIAETTHSKDRVDVTSPTVKLSTIQSVKGLEFRVVFLIGLDHLPLPERDPEAERKLAYVGLTRAQDLLYLLGSTRSGLLQELADAMELPPSVTAVQAL